MALESLYSLRKNHGISQTVLGGLRDTVKPKLLQVNADCDRVIVIDESQRIIFKR